MDWSRIAPEFEFDGSWRDIYIVDAGPAGWAAVWNRLRSLSPAPVLSTAERSGPMPHSCDSLRELIGGHGHLAIAVGGITFNCHFFDDVVIEFDFDPRAVKSSQDASHVAGFMTMLGEVTAKRVILTWENALHAEIARYEPSTSEVVWSPLEPTAADLEAPS